MPRPRRPPHRNGESGREKLCSKCDEWWPLDLYDEDSHLADGLRSECKACRSETRPRQTRPKYDEPRSETWVIWARWPRTKTSDELDDGWAVCSFLLWSKEDADRELAKLQVAHMGTPEFRIVRYRACKR